MTTTATYVDDGGRRAAAYHPTLRRTSLRPAAPSKRTTRPAPRVQVVGNVASRARDATFISTHATGKVRGTRLLARAESSRVEDRTRVLRTRVRDETLRASTFARAGGRGGAYGPSPGTPGTYHQRVPPCTLGTPVPRVQGGPRG